MILCNLCVKRGNMHVYKTDAELEEHMRDMARGNAKKNIRVDREHRELYFSDLQKKQDKAPNKGVVMNGGKWTADFRDYY